MKGCLAFRKKRFADVNFMKYICFCVLMQSDCVGRQEFSNFLHVFLMQVPEYIYPKDSVPEYTSILVPNVDSVRTDFLMHTIMRQGKAVLLIGEQGTAKTVMIKVGGMGKRVIYQYDNIAIIDIGTNVKRKLRIV